MSLALRPLTGKSLPASPAKPMRPAARPVTAPALATAPVPSDSLERSEAPANGSRSTLSLRQMVQVAEKLTGKKSQFKTEAELTAYLTSLEKAMPQSVYDPKGFLASLGLANLHASGRTDAPVIDAVRQISRYRPDTEFHGKPIWPQQKIFDWLVASPKTFLAMSRVANPVIEAKARLEGDWKKPLKAVQTPVPSDVAPRDFYKAVYDKLDAIHWQFGSDFHGGLPAIDNPAHPTYGTYQIARTLGFSDTSARRFGTMSNGIDENITPYGKTSPSPLDQIDRHFNVDRKGEDTRLVYAARHLEAAIQYGRQGAYEQAEIELGCGLHSLQDLFAHGQLSPAVHGTLGQFPDEVDWNPVGFYEASAATGAYMAAYMEGLLKSDAKPMTEAR